MALRVFSNCSSVSPVNPTDDIGKYCCLRQYPPDGINDTGIIGHRMLPVHPDQHLVVARLQGKMNLLWPGNRMLKSLRAHHHSYPADAVR